MKKLLENGVPRYEKKYLISAAQAEELKLGLEELCFRDKNIGKDNKYNIRSLYFDDLWHTSYYEKENGVDPRSKFRIRIYNCENKSIHLEEKKKNGGKILKERVLLSEKIFSDILNDHMEEIEFPGTNALFNRFMTKCYTNALAPSVIVDYDREPFVYPDGDVRITFDTNISFSEDFESFFDKDLFLQPIMPVGIQLLEVKYTEFLPEFIYNHLNRFHLKETTFSKFYLCEKYKRMGE